MLRPTPSLVCLLAALVFGSPARASHMYVPGDFPTIQGAIDSGADSVLVADGVFAENLVVTRGVELLTSDADIFEIEDNVITGTTEGIVISVGNTFYGVLHDNTVTDCSGNGVRVYSALGRLAGTPIFRHNTVRNCGGYGFEFQQVYAQLDSNRIESVGLDGIHLRVGATDGWFVGNSITHCGGAGMRLEDDAIRLSGNVVVDAASDGISLWGVPTADHNVIGRCGGTGLRITGGYGPTSIESNTVYLNHEAGFTVAGIGPPVSFDCNLSYRNEGAGLAWSGSGTPALECNDWRENAGGATSGVPVGATDLDQPPVFCDLTKDSVTLAWRGVDENGRALPAGFYVARVIAGGQELKTRIVRVR